METVLSVEGISKSYGSVRALQDITFRVPAGSVFGILGPNGSGKTTLLGIVLSVLQADAGRFIWLDDVPLEVARRQTGALLETPNFYPYLSAGDNLYITAQIKGSGMENIDKVLNTCGLLSWKNYRFDKFSLGMKQRLAIAAALLGSPKILVLDEPTNGLDPAGIAEIRNLISELSNQGLTVLLASHLLDEVEKICSHVAVFQKGKLLTSGVLDEVLATGREIEVKATEFNRLKTVLSKMHGVISLREEQNILSVAVEKHVLPEDINAFCLKENIVLSHLRLRNKSLETAFIELTTSLT